MEFVFTPTAEEHFGHLPRQTQKRIATKMRFYAKQPDPLQFAEPLTGSHTYRFRIGDYRVIFKIAQLSSDGIRRTNDAGSNNVQRGA
jgi:mRNA-degrading endonuclease RelE of RelBE toxin-antitoxin system